MTKESMDELVEKLAERLEQRLKSCPGFRIEPEKHYQDHLYVEGVKEVGDQIKTWTLRSIVAAGITSLLAWLTYHLVN
jgi:hypothetical protein